MAPPSRGAPSAPPARRSARWSSTRRCPATRRSSRTPPTSGRSSPWRTPRWATWAPTPGTRSPRSRTPWAWWCATLTEQPSNWRAQETLDAYLAAPRDRRHRGHRHPAAGAAPAHARRADGRHLHRGPLGGRPGGAGPDGSRHGGAGPRHRRSPPRSPTSSPRPRPNLLGEAPRARARAALRRGGLRLRPQALHAPASWWTWAAA